MRTQPDRRSSLALIAPLIVWLVATVALVLGAVAPALRASAHVAPPAPPAQSVASPAAPAHANPAPKPATKPATEERWYLLQMQGQRAGHMTVRIDHDDHTITEATTAVISIKRAGASVSLKISSEVRETTDGKMVSMKSIMNLGASPITTEYVFKDTGVEVRSSMNDKTTTLEQPLPEGDWMGPIAAGRAVEKALAEGKKEITVRTLDPSSGLKPLTYSRKVVERTTIDLLGKAVPAVKWTSTVDIMPGLETTEYADEKGRTLKSEMNIGAIRIDVIQTDREIATSELNPPELMTATLVKVGRSIKGARELRRAEYVLSLETGELPPLPATGVQRVTAAVATPGRATVVIDLDKPAPASEKDAGNSAYTAATTQADINDEKVKEVLAEALRDVADRADKTKVAETLRVFVHGFIDDKNLDVGFASASEVARTRQGDCSEHGVLLCTLLRGANIPARVASGVVYVDNFAKQEQIFGYHMWAQALLPVNGRPTWVDLDAAIDPEHAFDATHICLGTSTLADGDSINSLATLAPLIGKLKIEVASPK